MNGRSFLWLYWGLPTVILGVVLMFLIPVQIAMPIAGTLVVVGWVVIGLIGKRPEKKEEVRSKSSMNREADREARAPERHPSFKCQTCDKQAPRTETKVWNGKLVCRDCFEVLTREKQNP